MVTCPCCRGETAPITLERTIGGPLTLDLCHHCDGIWFDAGEQFRLMPDSTLRLIKEVQVNRAERRTDAGTRLLCPRCHEALAETYDWCRDTRYRFYRCANHDGVFFRFADFLRSQGLLHGLSDAEIEALKSRAHTLQCRNSGGPIAVEAQTCPHCGAPVSWLDEDYLARALRQLADDAT